MSTWKETIDVEEYNLDMIRKNNVTIGEFERWLKLFKYFNINVGILDINLYALEFASRSAGRYGVRMLPKIQNNPLSEMRYSFLFYEGDENFPDEARREMLVAIMKRTKPETLEKWLID